MKLLNSESLNQINFEPLNSENFTDYFNFDGVNINDCGENVLIRVNDKDLGEVNLQTFDAPFQDGGGVLSSYITERQIEVTMFVVKGTSAEVYQFIDDIKRKTNKQEGKLTIRFGSEYRYTYATLKSLNVTVDDKSRNIIKELKMSFLSRTPHFIARDPYSQTESITTLTHPIELTNNGSEETYYQLALVFNDASLTTVEVVKDGYTLTINEAFTDGDLLEIDGENKIVKKNTVPIDYDGIFVDLNIGSNPMQVVFTGTNTNTTINSKFLTRYR